MWGFPQRPPGLGSSETARHAGIPLPIRDSFNGFSNRGIVSFAEKPYQAQRKSADMTRNSAKRTMDWPLNRACATPGVLTVGRGFGADPANHPHENDSHQ